MGTGTVKKNEDNGKNSQHKWYHCVGVFPSDELKYHGHEGFFHGETNDVEGALVPFFTYRPSLQSPFFIEELITKFMGGYLFFADIKCSKMEDFNPNEEDMLKKCATFSSSSRYGNEDEPKHEYEKLFICSDYLLRIKEYDEGDAYISIYSKEKEKHDALYDFMLKKCEFEKSQKSKGAVNILMRRGNEMYLKPIEREYELIEENYDPELVKKIKNLEEEFKKDKGVVLLHGDPGTGKTSLIKCLPNFAKEKKFIFIPPSFGGVFAEPGFLEFMSDHKDSVLIIEDAESVLETRSAGENHAVSNILNLTDGILSEILKIQVICTLNCKISHIDQAVRRPGRMLSELQFDKLSVEQCNKRLKEIHPDKDYTTNKELTISEIYNFGLESDVKEESIGFRKR